MASKREFFHHAFSQGFVFFFVSAGVMILPKGGPECDAFGISVSDWNLFSSHFLRIVSVRVDLCEKNKTSVT